MEKESAKLSTKLIRALIGILAVCLITVVLFPELIPREKYVAVANDFDEPPAGSLRVLFVGNSHLFHRDVPHMVQRLVPKDARPLAFDALLSPGKWLGWHVAEGDVQRLGQQNRYDVLILQPQSTELIERPEEARAAVEKLSSYTAGARPILMQTWPRDPTRDAWTKGLGISRAEWNVLTAKNAASDHWEVAPVGDVWGCVQKVSRIDLWDPDGNHSSVAGAYLAALVLYRAIWGPRVSWAPYAPPGLPASVAAPMREAAKKCLDARPR